MGEQRVERRLSAVLVADVASYSRLMGANEVGTVRALKTLRREIVDPALSTHGGRVVKLTGDGILIEFTSAVDAVAYAVEVQRAMARRNAGTPPDRQARPVHVYALDADAVAAIGGTEPSLATPGSARPRYLRRVWPALAGAAATLLLAAGVWTVFRPAPPPCRGSQSSSCPSRT